MIRKYWSLHCDVKGCQQRTPPIRSKRKLKTLGPALGWQIYTDSRKKERARCLDHHKGNQTSP